MSITMKFFFGLETGRVSARVGQKRIVGLLQIPRPASPRNGIRVQRHAGFENYVDPRDQYERASPTARRKPKTFTTNTKRRERNDELRAPRHDVNNYTNPIPERDRLIPKPMERPKPGYIPTEVLIAMGGASLSNHIKPSLKTGALGR